MMKIMPVAKKSHASRLISRMINDLLSDINDSFPQLKDSQIRKFKNRPQPELSPATNQLDSLNTQVISSISRTPVLAKISSNEFSSVMNKLIAILDQPPGYLDEQSQLYLEQQLSDILGISVSATIDKMSLPYNTGVIESLPHLKLNPEDQLVNHQNHLEAGVSKHRSFFGWIDQDDEKYYVSLPLQLLNNWGVEADSIGTWFKHRKIVVVNPYDQRAVVAKVSDLKIRQGLKYQFGASPEVIREGFFWSPQAKGRVCAFFVDDVSNSTQLGLINFSGIYSDEKND